MNASTSRNEKMDFPLFQAAITETHSLRFLSSVLVAVLGLFALPQPVLGAGECSHEYNFVRGDQYGCPRLDGSFELSSCCPQGMMTVDVGLSSADLTGLYWGFQGESCGCELHVSTNQPPLDATVTLGDDPQPGNVSILVQGVFLCNICTNSFTNSASSVYFVNVSQEGDDGCAGGCQESSPALGNGALLNTRGPDFRLDLGRFSAAQSAGFLAIQARLPSWNLYKPALLRLPYYDLTNRYGAADVVVDSGGIRQVKVPQGLVHVSVVSTNRYDLQVFYADNVVTNGDGTYGTNGSAFVWWTIENPDAGSANTRLRITENRSGQASRTFNYEYMPESSVWKWKLTDPLPNRSVVSWETTNPNNSAETNIWREVRTGSAVLRHTLKKMELIGNRIVLRELIEGSDSATNITSYSYYGSTVAYTSNLLQRVDYPNGNWEYFQYDNARRLTTKFSAYRNSAPPAAGVAPTPSTIGCKVTEYAYTLKYNPGQADDDGVDDAGTYWPDLPRRIITKLPEQGQSSYTLREVARAYTCVPDLFEVREERCPLPGGKWGDTGNLAASTLYYDTEDAQRGRLKYKLQGDGTAVQYEYYSDANGILERIIEQSGEPDWAGGVLNGTKMQTCFDSLGRTISRTNWNIVNYAESALVSGEVFEYFGDLLQRSYRVVDLAGRTNTFNYGCCGLESTVDSDGAQVLYDHDALKRQTASTRMFGGTSGIKTTNILDAAGRTLATLRIGTNGNTITLDQRLYDVLGRVVKQTNALDGVTIYSESLVEGHLVKSNSLPDTGSQVDEHFRDGRLAKSSGTAVFGLQHEFTVEQDGQNGPWREVLTSTRLNTNGTSSSEWTKAYTDGLGRQYKVVYPDAAYSQTWYTNGGQIAAQRDPDNVATAYHYNGKGERDYTALDLNRNGQVDSGTDRVTQITNDVVSAHGTTVRRSQTFPYGDFGFVLTSMSETSIDGLHSWHTMYPDPDHPIQSHTETSYSQGSNRFVTTTSAEGHYSVNHFVYGRLASSTRYRSDDTQVSKTSYEYDAHGRTSRVIDARNGATSYTFNNSDLPLSITTPSPGGVQPVQTTSTVYDNMGRAVRVVLPDGSSVTNEYYLGGLLKKKSGSREYPVEYTHDYAGRMKTMKTWQNYAAANGAAETTWNYSSTRGWLVSKRYADDSGPDYTYTDGGRLRTRTWARQGTGGQRVKATYTYGFDDAQQSNKHGDVVQVSFSNDPQNSPDIIYGYDLMGRQTTITWGAEPATTTIAYDNLGKVLSESHSGGPLSGFSITNGYDGFLRRTNVALLDAYSVIQAETTNSFDTAGRLSVVGNGPAKATYSYLANSPLVEQISFANNGTAVMTTKRTYDYLNRLASIQSLNPQSATFNSFVYDYNSANQRTLRREADGAYWRYEYDGLAQVKSGKKFWPDGSPVPGQQFEYAFDDIGNRTRTRSGGDQYGGALRSADYGANLLNQYTNRVVPASFDVLGVANGTNNVTVNGSPADYRRGEYFQEVVNVANSSTAVWQGVAVTNTYTGAYEIGHVFVPKTPEVFRHDLDGNLTNDGRWKFVWDPENRLVRMVADSGVGPQHWIAFQYDWRGRRVAKSIGPIGSEEATNTVKFIYDDWNLVAVRDSESSVLQSFSWGIDLSGSMQGAGGVGGLLFVSTASSGMHFPAFDGNGNVMALVSAQDASLSAQYEYGPFGETIKTTGPMATANPFRFSTKYQDDETDLLYYGYRYYNASTGRWLNRDAIEQQGGPDLYGFVQNQPTQYIDILGNVRGDDFWPPPPPLPPIDCSGYEKTFGASPCRTCSNGSFGTQKDTYPERAKTICEGFKRRYDGTLAPLHIPASCVAKCLVKKESECQQYGWCDARNCCRLQAHFACYSQCGFVPVLGMPKGGPALGWEELIPACKRMGMSNLDILISGLF